MKRYAICKIIGDGHSPQTAFRPAIQDIVDPETGMRAYDHVSVFAVDSNGQPVLPWALVYAAGKDFKLIDGNADIDIMPDHPKSVKMSAMTTKDKNGMIAKLQNRNIDVSDIGVADGFSDLLNSIGKKHDIEFSVDSFDVSDV